MPLAPSCCRGRLPLPKAEFRIAGRKAVDQLGAREAERGKIRRMKADAVKGIVELNLGQVIVLKLGDVELARVVRAECRGGQIPCTRTRESCKRLPVAVSTDGFIQPTMTLLAMATDVSC
jgi:hypothetical protein